MTPAEFEQYKSSAPDSWTRPRLPADVAADTEVLVAELRSRLAARLDGDAAVLFHAYDSLVTIALEASLSRLRTERKLG